MGTLSKINNFRFFTDKGNEIVMQKTYQLTWVLRPSEQTILESVSPSTFFHSTLGGYFIASPQEDGDYQTIDKSTLTNEVTSYGDIYMSKDMLDEMSVADYIDSKLFDFYNNVDVTLKVGQTDYTATLNANYIFDDSDYQTFYGSDNEGVTYSLQKVYQGSYDNQEFYYVIHILQIPLSMNDDGTSDVYRLLVENIPNIGMYFPFVVYSGSFTQDSVSTEFIDANTLLVMMDDDFDSDTFHTPHMDEPYVLTLQPQEGGELSIITTDEYEVIKSDKASFDLNDEVVQEDGLVTPFSFAIGVQASVEGCYQNHLGMYLTNKDTQKSYFFGVITIKTEIIGEDERFRTFMNNFGVPDPATYSNLFKEQEYDEELKDYKLINKKSKELFLTYDQIFPYAGTYKALINAVNFLGYQDIVFKEWYKILDNNDQMRDVAVQAVDLSTGTMLKNVLSEYGITMGDYERYTKLNRLTMVYHLNEIIDTIPEEEKVYKKVNLDITQYGSQLGLSDEQKAQVKADGYLDYETLSDLQLRRLDKILNERIEDEEMLQGSHVNKTYSAFEWDLPIVQMNEFPFTQPIFIYRNTEIVAKLFAIKEWLERHIIGLNAYISDIDAEGIYIYRMKSQGYVTQHKMDDFSSEQYYTPNVKAITEFHHSNATMACTINEFSALSFNEYPDVTFDKFDKFDVSLPFHTSSDVSVLKISNTCECPVLADEYMFTLTNRPDTGTLYEFTKDENSQIYVNDMEINLLNDSSTSASIQGEDLPLIDLEIANIRKCYGKWIDNVQWTIREVIDQSTGNTNYELNNIGDGRTNSHYINSEQHVLLRPKYDFVCEGKTYKITNDETDTKVAFVEGKYYNVLTQPLNFDASNGAFYTSAYGDYVKSGDEYILVPDDAPIYYAKEVCTFEYTENNKWHVPMFVMSGFSFDNVDIPKEYEGLYDMGDDNKFVVEVIKGRFLFNDDKYNMGAELVFSNDENKMTSREQYVKMKYDYMSEKKRFIELCDSSIVKDIDDFSVDTSYGGYSVDELKGIYDRQKDILLDQSTGNLAYQEYQSYVVDASYVDSIQEFVDKRNELQVRKNNYSLYQQVYDEYYQFNKCIDVNVSRLGDYEVQVSAFDRYNNIYNNKSDDKYSVVAKPIGYDLLMNQSYSNNDKSFYRFNVNGELLDSSTILYVKSMLDDKPKFPKSYNIYDIESAYDASCEIEYMNITYAIDTPKKNDYFIVSNLSEICTGKDDEFYYGSAFDSSDITTKLNMLDENPDRVNLYQDDASIMICIYDENKQEDVDVCGPTRVRSYYHQDSQQDKNYADDSFLIVDDLVPIYDSSLYDASTCEYESVGEFMDTYKDKILNDNYKCYILNVCEYDVTLDNMANNYENNTCDIYLEGETQQFYLGDVIKLRFYLLDDEKVLGETAYRIIHIDKDDVGYTYTLNGCVDTLRLEGLTNNFTRPIGIKMMYPYKRPVHYTLRVNDDAFEYARASGYYRYNVLKTIFHYNNMQMFANDYLDNTFNGYIYDYDMVNLLNIWDDDFFVDSNAVYAYSEFPITIPQGRHLIAKPDESDDTFEGEYKVCWRWHCRTFDDIDNWDEHDNTNDDENLFRSVNRYLQIKPDTLGSNSLEMTCIDRYGNRLVNKGSGRIYIKEIV